MSCGDYDDLWWYALIANLIRVCLEEAANAAISAATDIKVRNAFPLVSKLTLMT